MASSIRDLTALVTEATRHSQGLADGIRALRLEVAGLRSQQSEGAAGTATAAAIPQPSGTGTTLVAVPDATLAELPLSTGLAGATSTGALVAASTSASSSAPLPLVSAKSASGPEQTIGGIVAADYYFRFMQRQRSHLVFSRQNKLRADLAVGFFDAMATDEERKTLMDRKGDSGAKKIVVQNLSSLVEHFFRQVFVENRIALPSGLLPSRKTGKAAKKILFLSAIDSRVQELRVHGVRLIADKEVFKAYRESLDTRKRPRGCSDAGSGADDGASRGLSTERLGSHRRVGQSLLFGSTGGCSSGGCGGGCSGGSSGSAGGSGGGCGGGGGGSGCGGGGGGQSEKEGSGNCKSS